MTIDRIILKNNKLPKLKKRKNKNREKKKNTSDSPSKMVKEKEILVYTPRGLNVTRVVSNFSKDIEKAIASNKKKLENLKQKNKNNLNE